MRVSRVYLEEFEQLRLENIVTISKKQEQYGYITKVLRLKKNFIVKLFNNTGYDYICEILEINNKLVKLEIKSKEKVNTESKLNINLAQAISKPHHFEMTLQKAVELGVFEITPIISERAETMQYNEKKVERYKKIIISACEQSNRAIVPKLHNPVLLKEFLSNNFTDKVISINLIPDPKSRNKIDISAMQKQVNFNLLIGPEGGFTDEEIKEANNSNFNSISLGPRILRTETAGIALISYLQLGLE